MDLPTLYFDLETIPAGEIPIVHYPKKPVLEDVKTGNRKGDTAILYANEKLPGLIDKWMDEKKALDEKNEEDFRKRATSSLTAKVVCLGYALGDSEPEVLTGTEQEIISGFNALLNRYGQQKVSLPIVGHNIIEFDIPIIFHRAIKFQQVSLVNYILGINHYQGRDNIFDIMREWNLMSYRKYTKLDDIATFLGIPGKGDIDGSKVWDLWKDNKFQQVYDYCMDDVILTRNIYKRLKSI